MKRFLKESKSTNKDVYTKNRAADQPKPRKDVF